MMDRSPSTGLSMAWLLRLHQVFRSPSSPSVRSGKSHSPDSSHFANVRALHRISSEITNCRLAKSDPALFFLLDSAASVAEATNLRPASLK